MRFPVLSVCSAIGMLAVFSFVPGCEPMETSPSTPTPPPPNTDPVPPPIMPVLHEPVINQELMITDLSVVNDPRAQGPDGAWSFGHLMKEMAAPPNTDGSSVNPEVASRFVVNWLKHWDSPQAINGFTVPARSPIRDLVINPWKVKDGQPGVADDVWDVNLANAPFRLLAIVNRIDLNKGRPSDVLSAGEGRFVYGVVDSNGAPLQFTVIFEYELVAKDRQQLRGWAQSWHALGTMPFGAPYNQALQTITDRFTKSGGAPAKPNGNALNQLRTNEIALVLPVDFNLGWELREFNIVGSQLKQVTVKQNAANAFQNTPDLASFINANAPELLDGTFVVPQNLDDGRSFMGGSSIIAPPARGFFWDAPGITNDESRHNFAFLSCNGCHHVETGTTNFLHVGVRRQNEQAALSGFLTGITAPDPKRPAVSHEFNDLRDRAEILKLLAREEGAIRLESLRKGRANRVH